MIGLRASPSSTSIVQYAEIIRITNPIPISIPSPSIHPSILPSIIITIIIIHLPSMHPRPSVYILEFIHSATVKKRKKGKKKTHLYVNLPHNAGDHKVRIIFFRPPAPFFCLSCLVLQRIQKCHKSGVKSWHSGRKVVGDESIELMG